MNMRVRFGLAALSAFGIACGGAGGGGGVTTDPGTPSDLGTDEAASPPDVPVGDDAALDGTDVRDVEPDAASEVSDVPDGGPDAAETPPCGEECEVTNEHGTCKGWRPCVDGGLGSCDARTPAPEVCDGVDNDCDGETDENEAALCSDGVACTVDRCDGSAGCIHPVAPGACLIAGVCYGAGDLSPQNECLFCLPDKNAQGWSPRPGGCDDGNVCTKRDTCVDGTCVGKENVCGCEEDADCDPHEDGNLCNGTLYCNRGKFPAVCEVDPASVVKCDPSEDTRCLANLCDPATGKCAMTPVFEGGACDDGEGCTKQDRCIQGQCIGTAYSCDDLLPCTQDHCDGEGGCEHVLAPYYCVIGEPGVNAQCIPHGEHHPGNVCLWCNAQVQASGWSPWSGPCDDGDACTLGDTCFAGSCVGDPYACDDGLECTLETCHGDKGCTVIEVVEGFCLIDGRCWVAGTRDPENDCLWCDPAVNARGWSPHALSCDDGDACTTADRCVRGVCVGGPPPNCDDDNLCTNDRCDPEAGGCIHENNSAPCDDGNPCTVGDGCAGGQCTPGPLNACACERDEDCPDDGNLCNGRLVCDRSVYPHRCVTDPQTVVTCDPSADTTCQKNRCVPATGACQMTPVNEGGACDDANLCTYGERCLSGLCVGTFYNCDDGLSCTTDVCRGDGTCSHTLEAGFCLIAGVCVPAGTVHEDNPCLTCNPASQKYTWTPKPNGTLCDDREPCSYADTCKAGQCRGVPYGCDDLKGCTLDTCLGDGTCSHTIVAGSCLIAGTCYQDGAEGGPCRYCNATLNPNKWTARNGTPCNDGQACTKDDRCDGQSGECVGVLYACDDGKWCTLDVCKGDGTCDFSEIQAGACLIGGVCYARGDEDPANPCRRCLPEVSKTTWTPKGDGVPCTDHNECTLNDRCQAGVCMPGPVRTCDDRNPCTTDRCEPESGCVFVANDLYRVDFETQGGFTFENSDLSVGWRVIPGAPGYLSGVLYYGDPETWSYETPGQANFGIALSEAVFEIAPWQKAYLSFDLFLDNEWSNRLATGNAGRQWNDVLDVFLKIEGIGEILVWSSSWGFPRWWVQTMGGVPVRPAPIRVSGLDLNSALQWFGHPPFRVGFLFRTGDEHWNAFGGVLVDNVVIGLTCDDGNACIQGESCQAGVCQGLPAVCDDANDCTADVCDPGLGCQYPPSNEQGPCDDHNLCTEETTCTMGACLGGVEISCAEDGNDCTSDVCDPMKGCAYPQVPDFASCSQAGPYGTCLSGECVGWEMISVVVGDYDTSLHAVQRVPNGPLTVVGHSDVPDGNRHDPARSLVLDAWIPLWDPAEEMGELWGLSKGLAVGFKWSQDVSLIQPNTAAWDPLLEQWTFDPARNPLHVPSTMDSGLFGVTSAPWSNQFFLGGAGGFTPFTSYLERCTFDPLMGSWFPCERMAAFADLATCAQPNDLFIRAIWAMNDWNVWAVGTSSNPYGVPSYTILYFNGNEMTACGGLSGFRGAFSLDWPNGLQQPSMGQGILHGIHGRGWDNLWAVGSDGKIFARTGWMLGWQEMNPAGHGVAWGLDHTAYGVFVEDQDVHIVGTIGYQVPFYLHARRTGNLGDPWTFDRKIVFDDLASDQAFLTAVTKDPNTGAIVAVGTIYDGVSDLRYGILMWITSPD